MLLHVLHVLIHLLLDKAAKGLESELPEADFLDNGSKLLEGQVRVHIIFYSLSGNIDVLPVDLHRQYHFSEYLYNILSFDDPLFGCIIYMTVVFEQSVEDLLLHLGQLDVIRVRLFLRVGRYTNSTC